MIISADALHRTFWAMYAAGIERNEQLGHEREAEFFKPEFELYVGEKGYRPHVTVGAGELGLLLNELNELRQMKISLSL